MALLNGRISEKSVGRYKLVRPFIRRVLNDLTLAAMQTEQDAARIEQLGMRKDRISIAGNLKFDSASTPSDFDLESEIRNRFAFNGDRPLIVAASTHDPEEGVVIDAFRGVRQAHSGARLLIAPRHPERFEEVASVLANSGFSAVRRSATPSAEDVRADVVLLDAIGE